MSTNDTAGFDEQAEGYRLLGDDTWFPENVDDEATAAEQGNREEDEMVSEGDGNREVADLSGDQLDVDALMDDGIHVIEDDDGIHRATDEG